MVMRSVPGIRHRPGLLLGWPRAPKGCRKLAPGPPEGGGRRNACLARFPIPDRGCAQAAVAGPRRSGHRRLASRLPRQMQKPMSQSIGASPPPVVVRELRKVYRDVTAVDGVSFSLGGGSITAL